MAGYCLAQAMVGHGWPYHWPWLVMAGHGWSWLAMAGHGKPWLESDMAVHGGPWPGWPSWLTMDWSVLAHGSDHVHRFFATIVTPALPVLWHASAIHDSDRGQQR